MNFKVGQKVVCISKASDRMANSFYLTVGKIYVVERVFYCCGCGSQTIHVGLPPRDSELTLCIACDTRNHTVGVSYVRSSRFAPLEEWEQSEQAVKELLQPLHQKV